MKDGFLKAAALSPSLRVADCNYNASQIVSQLQDAAARGVRLAVFPEFCLTGYTCGDLFLQRTLQQGALDALQTVLDASRELDVVALVGLPLLVRGKLYNCAAVLCGGRLLGLVPKTYLPNYGEFYEKRQFIPGSTEVECDGLRTGSAFRYVPALPLPPDAQLRSGRGDLRRPVERSAPLHLPHAGRCHRHCEPFGQR